MDFWNFMRSLFIGQDFRDRRFPDDPNNSDEDNFDNRMWQMDVDDSSSFFGRNNQFHIFSDPLQITRYFESQVENMFKNFFNEFNFEDADSSSNVFSFGTPQEESLRDRMLKPNNDQPASKLDKDLDGIVTPDNFSAVWDEHHKPEVQVPRFQIMGKTMRKEFFFKPDGTVEKRQIVKDFEGNEETIISRQIGDKIYTSITKKDKDGVKTRIEEISEANERDLTKLPPNET